jgi:hypothetical protein
MASRRRKKAISLGRATFDGQIQLASAAASAPAAEAIQHDVPAITAPAKKSIRTATPQQRRGSETGYTGIMV